MKLALFSVLFPGSRRSMSRGFGRAPPLRAAGRLRPARPWLSRRHSPNARSNSACACRFEREHSMAFVEIQGVKIYWDEQGRGEPVLLIMGLAYPSQMWYRTRPLMASLDLTVALDNRG